MKVFRIYTENKNPERLKELISICFDGFTVIKTKGFWKGVPENALLIEIYTENVELIRALASAIKKNNKQEAVLVTSTDVDFQLV